MYNPSKPYKHKIFSLIQKTWNTPYVTVTKNTYPIIQRKSRYASYQEVDHTDGIGTKGLYHWHAGTFKEAVIDGLAMNLNDLALVRAVPYKLSNHITVPVEDGRVVTVLAALALECKKRQIAITGGENSFHNNMEGMDLSITVTGFVEKIKPNMFRTGDVLIGLKSSGLHSNGFTTVRKVFKTSVRKEFTVPTAIYLDIILELDKKVDIHGMMHMTGGSYTKLKDLLKHADVLISGSHKLKPQPIFEELYKRGISDGQMYQTFNCGVGFIFSVSPEEVETALQITKGAVIGEIVKGDGKVKIESMFSRKTIEY